MPASTPNAPSPLITTSKPIGVPKWLVAKPRSVDMNEWPQLGGGANTSFGVLLLAGDAMTQLFSAVLPAIGEEVVNASARQIGMLSGESLSMPDEVRYQQVTAVHNGTALRATAMERSGRFQRVSIRAGPCRHIIPLSALPAPMHPLRPRPDTGRCSRSSHAPAGSARPAGCQSPCK